MIWNMLSGFALVLALLAVWQWGEQQIKDAAKIVAAVWLVNFAYALVTGDYANYRFLFLVDVAAAAFVLTPPCTEARRVVGVLYIQQVVFHGVYGSYGLRGLEGPRDAYLQGLWWLGVFQILALLVGAFNDWSRKRHHRYRVVGGGAVSVAAFDASDGGEA
jgi:hypothetical protein